ncbi:30S ribosomal protein S20 [Desulfovibrio psychrotolerans]|uniref:Small ribosomal subunit protein bS20 n=1 Tax=Desulfovibrio psychrotolerans TaxID=415242 RepID=A0A7J0BPC6_9BACT|nr:30S ribosomal protein S20 [Desulfovibrio psychrotolerans]GFM35556.1 30S ribosomal protein S20 [Desulfovibrio psychrotolerans]
MANHKSAIKRHRQSLKRATRNRAMKTRVRNTVKAVRTAILQKDKDQAQVLLGTANSVLDKAAGKGVIHWRMAARSISRLSKAVAEIA